MGATNNGTQTIIWDYKQPIIASEINKWFYTILKAGVYDGGALTIDSGNNILIAPLHVIVETSTNQAVHINTSTNATLTISETTPYVTCQFSWADSETNYMDFTAKAVGDILTTDVILGMGVYVLGTLTSFDYTAKTWGFIDRNGNIRGTGDLTIGNDVSIGGTLLLQNSNINHLLLEIGDDMKFLRSYKAISSSFPWFCLSLPDQNWTIDHYSTAFISAMRAKKIIYDEIGSSPVSSFSGSWSSGVFTLDNNTANVTMLAALDREYLYAGSPATNWRLLNDGTYDYNITAISTSARTITVSTADHTPSGTSISIYKHRVYGSTTSARHFSEAGLGFYQAGGDKISGLRRLDQMQQIIGSAVGNTVSLGWGSDTKTVSGALSFSALTGAYASASSTGSGQPRGITFDSANSPSARTGTKTEIEAGTLLAYIYVGTYTE